MQIKIIAFIFVFLFLNFHVNSQETNNLGVHSPKFATVRPYYSLGKVVHTNDFLRTENINGSPITEVSNFGADLLFRTSGAKDWHQLYNYPTIGVGLQYMWFSQTNELGTPLSLYAIFEQHIINGKKAYLDYSFHFGVSLGWNAYDSVTNPYNVVIGSTQTLYAHLGLIYHRNIGDRLGLDASLGFSHASNGALKMPNFGINIFDPRIALTYDLNAEKPAHKPHEISPIQSKNEISLSAAIGTKQFDFTSSDSTMNALFRNKSFTVYNFVLLYQRQISNRSKIGGGIDFTVDPSDNPNGLAFGDTAATYPVPFDEKAKLALVLSYQLNIGKLALILQPGFYFYRTTHDPTPFFYQRIGVRYDIWKNIYAGASLRAVNFGQADWIELTAGYKVNF